MGLEFLGRVRKTSVITALLLFWVVVVYWNAAAGVAWLLGCLWSLINIYFIGLLVRTMTSPGSKRLRLTLIFLVKVPVLYAVGYVLLTKGRLPLVALLAGFMWPLLVITLKVLGRAVLRLDGRAGTAASQSDLAEKGYQR
jgi:hypothetical protein